MEQKNIDKLVSDALAIEARDARESGSIGYMARALVQATMPHKRTTDNEFVRKNGLFTLTMLSPSNIGLPYGVIPRLLMAWITTEAVRTNNREIILGDSLSSFMNKLDLVPTGGRWGSITRLKEQTKRLFSCSISCNYDNKEVVAGLNMQLVEKYQLWWTPQNPDQISLWESIIVLGKNFFDEITQNPVPLDIDALKALKKSPLAIDIYCWLTYRMSYLKKRINIPWKILQNQFGADYADNSQGLRDFKKAFLRELKKVHAIYSKINFECDDSSFFILHPSKTHILPRL